MRTTVRGAFDIGSNASDSKRNGMCFRVLAFVVDESALLNAGGRAPSLGLFGAPCRARRVDLGANWANHQNHHSNLRDSKCAAARFSCTEDTCRAGCVTYLEKPTRPPGRQNADTAVCWVACPVDFYSAG